MNIRVFMTIILAVALTLTACGRPEDETTTLSGRLDTTGSTVEGPGFVLITNTDNLEEIEQDPVNTVVSMITVADDMTFSFDLAELGLHPGDEVCLIGLIDNDYRKGIPYPTAGDYIGFHIENLSTKYTIPDGGDTLVIPVNRKIYDFNASVSGTIAGNHSGDVILFAYSGEINSLNLTNIDYDNIVAFKKISKGSGAQSYTMKILPYGKPLPIENTYIAAVRDNNGNGKPDGGDELGFYSTDPAGYPTPVTIEGGNLNGVDISFTMFIPESSGADITLEGSFTPPAGYTSDSAPVFILVADTADPNVLFTDPLTVIKEFKKLETGETTFSIDLSFTDLAPGDEVMVLALWDKDYVEGQFPSPTNGDKIGFFQNSNADTYSFTVPLQEPVSYAHHGKHPETNEDNEDYTFSLNKYIYTHETSLNFKISDQNLPEGIQNYDSLIAVAVYSQLGINIPDFLAPSINVDQIIGLTYLSFNDNPETEYTLHIMTALDDAVTIQENNGNEEINIYIGLIYDSDNNGLPTKDEDEMAMYTKKGTIFTNIKNWKLKLNTQESLTDPETIKFTGDTY